jgi:hypothetical protein
MNYPAKLGCIYYFRVTGNANGTVWGTDVYTQDSSLATAAVHAGVLQNQQTGIVKITMLPGQPHYQGTMRNGVASHSWQNYPMSFRIASATATEDETVTPDQNKAVVNTSTEKVSEAASELSELLNCKVVVNFSNETNVSGKITKIGRNYIIIEDSASASKYFANTATLTYIAILPKK